MAEGGSSIKDSDAFYDYNCTDCLSRKNAFTEAILYCPECNKYLCKPCWVCAHDVIGRGNVDKWGQPSKRLQFDPCPSHKGNVIQLYCKKHDAVCCPVCGQTDHKKRLQFDPCPSHKGNVIQLYCKKHDAVCCPVCGQTDHKLCGELQYIPLVASARGSASSLKRTKRDVQELQTRADKLGKDRTSRLAGLDNQEQQLVAAVQEHRAKIDAWLDDLQEQSLTDIRMHIAILTDRYKSEVAMCDAIQTEMAQLQKKLDAASKDEALMFSRLKQGAKQVEDKTHLISDIANSKILDGAQFVPHSNLEQQVKSLQGLGTLLTDPNIDKIQTPGLGKVKGSQGQGQGSQHVPLNRPYTVQSKTSVSVKAKEYELTCNISGMCQMPDGSIIVADYNNNNLKRLDSTYKVTSHCSLFIYSRPYDVCPTEAGQVAVASWGQTIQFVSVGATMTRTKSFSTDHDCDSLAYSNNCLFVVKECGTSVYVYNLSGTRLRTINTDQHGNQLFSQINRITASPDGARLYVTDTTGLVTVGTEGNLLSTFTSPDLYNGAWAVCVDRSDNVFVKSRDSPNVIQVEKGEKQMAKIISSSDKIKNASALCFDGVNLRLLVSVNMSNTVHVLHFSK